MTTRLPTGSLVITLGRDGSTPYYEGKWRWAGRQHKRRLGKAWLVPTHGPSGYKKAPGRPTEGFLSERDAYQALTALIEAHAAEEAQNALPVVLSFGRVAELWFERAQRRGLKPFTLKLYRQLLDAYVLDKAVYRSKRIPRSCPFAETPIDAVSKDDMRGWFDPIPYSPQKAKVLLVVRSVCAFAVSEGWVRENVAASVECRAPISNGDYEFYDRSEIERLIAVASNPHDATLYATAFFTGLRKGELFGLQWRDIDFERSRITVHRNWTLGQIGTPKNGRSRTVPLVPELATLLKQHKRRKLNPPTAAVFSGHPDRALKRYRRARSKAGLRLLPFHSLRHSFGSHAVNVATLVQVRDWMGHSDLRTTGRYLHAKSLDSDADLLAAAFG